jgi:hypothetical protein
MTDTDKLYTELTGRKPRSFAKYREILLPVLMNDGITPYDWAHVAFKTNTANRVGGITVLPHVAGVWFDEHGREYAEQSIPYRIAATDAEWAAIVADATRLFPDQKLIFTAMIGFVDMVDGLDCGGDFSRVTDTIETRQAYECTPNADCLAFVGNVQQPAGPWTRDASATYAADVPQRLLGSHCGE